MGNWQENETKTTLEHKKWREKEAFNQKAMET
jgi:hypothetical protein